MDLVAVRVSDGWRVSPLATILTSGKGVLDELSQTQVLYQIDLLMGPQGSTASVFSIPTTAIVIANDQTELEFKPSEVYRVVDLDVSTPGYYRFVQAGDGESCLGGETISPSGDYLWIGRDGQMLERGVHRLLVFSYVEDGSGRFSKVDSCRLLVESG